MGLPRVAPSSSRRPCRLPSAPRMPAGGANSDVWFRDTASGAAGACKVAQLLNPNPECLKYREICSVDNTDQALQDCPARPIKDGWSPTYSWHGVTAQVFTSNRKSHSHHTSQPNCAAIIREGEKLKHVPR